MITPRRIIVAFVLSAWAVTALADGINNSGNVGNSGTGLHEGILNPGVAVAFTPPLTGALTLEDNASFLLLEDGVSHLCLESGC